MSHSDQLLHAFTDWNDALTALVHELGGFKKVGARLRPEFETKPEQAAQWLRDCLNADKRERLNPDQVVLLLRLGREQGVHAAKFWLDAELGYEQGKPLKPEDAIAELQRRYIESVHQAREIADRMERLARSPIAAVRSS